MLTLLPYRTIAYRWDALVIVGECVWDGGGTCGDQDGQDEQE